MFSFFQRLPSASTLILLYLHLQDVASQSTTVVGGTTITMSANPVGVPTLTYNCARMPAICNNVHSLGGQYQLNDLNWGLKGTLATVNHIVLHADTNDARKTARRNSVCPGTWKNSHTCPEPDQPPVVPDPFNKGGKTVYTGGFKGAVKDFATRNYNIRSPDGFHTGMNFTCDEFPPAMTIEGGATGGSHTYCAPGAAKDCDDTFNDQAYTRSEQDFQSSGHGVVKGKAVGANPPADYAWEFHFQTAFDGADSSWATRVDYYDVSTGNTNWNGYGVDEREFKRSAPTKHLISQRTYPNSTVVEYVQEVDFEHGLSGEQHEDIFANVDESRIMKRYLGVVDLETNFEDFEEGLVKRDDDSCAAVATETYAPTNVASETWATVACSVQTVATMVNYS